MENYNKHNDLISNFLYLLNRLYKYLSIQNEANILTTGHDEIRQLFGKQLSPQEQLEFNLLCKELDEVCFILRLKNKLNNAFFDSYETVLLSRFKYINWREIIKIEISNQIAKNKGKGLNYFKNIIIAALEEIRYRTGKDLLDNGLFYMVDLMDLEELVENKNQVMIVDKNDYAIYPIKEQNVNTCKDDFDLFDDTKKEGVKENTVNIQKFKDILKENNNPQIQIFRNYNNYVGYFSIDEDVNWIKKLTEKDLSKKIILKNSISQKKLINELHKIILDYKLINKYKTDNKKDVENFIYFITKKENDITTKHSLPSYNMFFADKYKARIFVLCFYYLMTKGAILTKKMELFKILSDALNNRGIGVRTLQKEIEKISNEKKYSKIKNSYLDYIYS